MKTYNNRAWFLILPVIICVAFSAILPLMTIVNYSVQDIISPTQKIFVGMEWFRSVMRDSDLHGALSRQLVFSLAVLLIQIPLGVLIALAMPASGWRASLAFFYAWVMGWQGIAVYDGGWFEWSGDGGHTYDTGLRSIP